MKRIRHKTYAILIIAIAIVIGCQTSTYASIEESTPVEKNSQITSIPDKDKTEKMINDQNTEAQMNVDCTIKIKTGNGSSEKEIEITVYDVSIWQCAKLKLATLFL